MDAEEVLRRRDVVVHERHAARERVGRPRRARSDGEVMDQDVVGRDRADHLAVVGGQVLEPAVGGFDEDLGLVARVPGGRAGCRSPRARWRRRSRASRAPGGRGRRSCAPIPAESARGRRATAAGRACGARTSPAAVPALGLRRTSVAFRSPFRRKLLLQLSEHVEVLPLDHRPRVVPLEELAAVPAEPRVQRAVRLERIQRLDELLVAPVDRARRCCGCTVPSARRSARWPAPAGRAPTPRAPPSTGSRSTTA